MNVSLVMAVFSVGLVVGMVLLLVASVVGQWIHDRAHGGELPEPPRTWQLPPGRRRRRQQEWRS